MGTPYIMQGVPITFFHMLHNKSETSKHFCLYTLMPLISFINTIGELLFIIAFGEKV